MIRKPVMTVCAALAATAALAGCGGGTTTTSTSSAPPTTTTTVAPAGPTVTDAQAQVLCADIEAQLQNWRVQGPTLGRGGFNILVQTWAAQSGLNLAVIQDRTIVDTVTTDSCSDVRDQAVQELAVPDLASALVGL